MTIRSLLFAVVIAVGATHAGARPVAAADVVLVAGATGGTGRLVVTELLARGFKVRGLTREASAAPDVAGVEWMSGDVTQPQTLKAAVKGAHIVVSAIGAHEPTGQNGFEAVDWGGNRNLIDAAKTAGVRQFLMVSAGSAGEGAWTDPRLARLGASRRWKAEAETYLRASPLPYTIVAPGGLRDYPGHEQGLRLAPRRDYAVGLVARGDVAALIAACAGNTACFKKTITVVNDPAGSPEGWQAALAALPVDTAETIRGR